MTESWSDIEVELIVADYFSMLVEELQGKSVNKSQHRKLLMPFLNNRSHGSVEFKHQNISAVLIEMGIPFIKGYKPRYNIQRSKLITNVENYIRINHNLEPIFRGFADSSNEPNKAIDFASLIASPPEIKKTQSKMNAIRRPLKVNYLEREQNNRDLGIKGEEIVIQYERFSLINAGKEVLADRIEWVSKDVGDGLGFDILSKNIDGSDKYVEVKTTKLSKETPFFFSSNEFNFSIENEPNYHLYRIFNFNNNTQLFTLKGRFDHFCKIEAVQYKGRF